MTTRVLVVEDDDANRLLLERFLTGQGYDVAVAGDGPGALRAVIELTPDMVLLDLGLPGLDGLDVLRRLRRDSGVPVLVLTGRNGEHEMLTGFAEGADDYVVKPYSLPEVAARVQALLRRGQPQARAERFEYDNLIVDAAGVTATLDGEPLDLTAKEFALLAFLAASPERCFTRAELLEHVWGSTAEWQQVDTVTEHVRRIRRKLGHDAWIETVRGVGYRFTGVGERAV